MYSQYSEVGVAQDLRLASEVGAVYTQLVSERWRNSVGKDSSHTLFFGRREGPPSIKGCILVHGS